MRRNTFDKLIAFLDTLDQGKISYTLAYNRDQAIIVLVTVPGERWEVEFLADGSVEVERFISRGEVDGEDRLAELIARCSDQEEDERSDVYVQTLG